MIVILFALLTALLPLVCTASSPAGSHPHSIPRLPLHFEENRGQAPWPGRYVARGDGYHAAFDETGFSIAAGSKHVRINLEGASPALSLEGSDRQPGISSYFTGADPAKWRTNIPHFGRVIYKHAYPGVDLVFYGRQRSLEYDVVASPGADLGKIHLSFSGARDLRISPEGDLVLQIGDGELRQLRPHTYQEVDGKRNPVECDYVLLGGGRVGFDTSAYDASKPLVIDPVLSYSTYLGGSMEDRVASLAVDPAGNVYITGTTWSSDLATPGTFQTSGPGDRAFVMKLNSSGTAIIYAAYFGASAGSSGVGIAVNAAGEAFVAGHAFGFGFPVTPGAAQTSVAGRLDVFVTKLNAVGSALLYSTLFGGSDDDMAGGIAIDALGNAYVAGGTVSRDLPTTNKAYQFSPQGYKDAFLFRLNATGSALDYCTYLGGGFEDEAHAVAIDDAGGVYLAGTTRSIDFPTTPGAPQTPPSVGDYSFNGFITKFNPGAQSLAYSTYLLISGAIPDDRLYAIAVDSSHNLYVAGTSQSNLPTVPGSYTAGVSGGGRYAFAAKLNPAGTTFVYLAKFGGSNDDRALSIALDAAGNAYIAGTTASPDFPVTPGAPQLPFAPPLGSSAGFALKLNPAGSAPVYSTYLGATVTATAVDANNNAYYSGWTYLTDFPVTTNALKATPSGIDIFLVKITDPSACAFSISPGAQSATVAATAVTVNITAPPGCNWIAANAPSWATFGGPKAGSGNGSVTMNVAANTGPLRSATISIAGNPFTLSQASGCYYTINPNILTAPLAGGSFTVDLGVDPACPVSAVSTVPWIVIRSVGSGRFSFDVSPLVGSGGRTAAINVAGQVLIVRQGVVLCFFTVNPASITAGSAAGTGTISVSGPLGCPWSVTSNASWINFTPSSGAGDGVVSYTMQQNPAAQRTATIDIGGQTVTFTQLGGPALLPLSPASGSGTTAAFTITARDAISFTNITSVALLVNAALDGQGGCFVLYDRATNALYLVNDSGNGSTRADLGTAMTVQNSQCALRAAASSASGSGADFTLTIALAFQPAFAGPKTVYVGASNAAGFSSGLQPSGAWTVTAGGTPISISPASGAGSMQSFVVQFTNLKGAADIASVTVLVNSILDGRNACFLYLDRPASTIYLINDASTSSTAVTLGGSVSAQNGQCSVDGARSSLSASGNTLTLTLALAFRPAFNGPKTLYASAQDSGGVSSGFKALGTWTATTGPSIIGLSPSSGVGASQVFAVTLGHPNGFGSISSGTFLINPAIDGRNACFLYFDAAANAVFVINDSGTGSTRVNLGTNTMGSNSQCELRGATSSASGTGNYLTLRLDLNFIRPFATATAYNTYLSATDNAGLTAPLQQGGTWYVGGQPTPLPVGPPIVSGLNPFIFTFQATDLAGYANLSGLYVLFNKVIDSRNACMIYVDRIKNKTYLFNDQADTLLEATGYPVTNTRCAINGVPQISGGGNTLTVTISISFFTAGTNNIWMNAVELSGYASGLALVGQFTR